ncbi:cytochrome [Rhodobacteraceae bacterium WD3A24]|nr:cytochrome [Rhodobacteraceae bacterium WD3A24]
MTDAATTDRPAAPHAAGCPFSGHARRFDPFGEDYQRDPAEALRWSREGEPVFYSEVLGYWVVSRYDDIKAIFRDNITFSPSIALEKITPPTDEALEILRKYDFNLQRTMVNEDEPVHMERRRALLDAFSPEALEEHAPMVRRLVREKVDAMIDKGEADLVDELLWEVPLTVALHFLGVPEEDMAKLREFSVAHTVNTWGRPSDEEQRHVAEGVGRFWQYSGEVLARMQAGPDGHGWMYDMIRKNREMPEVVTDNYLHSMMMAIIVAAHETTAHATANAFRQLLSRPEVWAELCETPALIPNAAEECLRHSGSVVAWRRIATRETQVGGVTIPEGGKILMVTASANHDPRHFENPDDLDIYRDNTAEHLTFGYGSHQCMGKNLGRMEMRIILEEFTRRLPHMELAPDQDFTFLPNTSFRGPEHVWVRWDPARNPERADPSIRDGGREFPVGAPSVREVARSLRVAERRHEATGVMGLVLEHPSGRALPRWSPGAHLDVILPGGETRKYSLCGPAGAETYQIAVLREPESRGGSAWLHDAVQAGDRLSVRGPRNHFRLDEDAPAHVLIAGGIGITPIIAMADRLRALGRDYRIHYAGRARAGMAFADRLERDHGDRLTLYPGDAGARMDLGAIFEAAPAGAQICACGPERLLSALEAMAEGRDCTLTVEHFSASSGLLDPANETAFEVELRDSDLTLTVPADRTLLEVLRSKGIDVASDCEEGLCGSCELEVVAGDVDHRDRVLSRAERREGTRMMACCSRARNGGKLVLGA